MPTSALPGALKLFNVPLPPLADQSQGTCRQASREDPTIRDRDERDVVAVLDVEVRRRMVTPVHVDHEAVEGR